MQFESSHRTVVFAKEFIMIRFGSLERDYSLSKEDMTLEKGLRSQHGKDVQLHNLLGSPRPVNKLRTISASMYKVIAMSYKKTSKSCASFLNQNGLNSQEGGKGGVPITHHAEFFYQITHHGDFFHRSRVTKKK